MIYREADCSSVVADRTSRHRCADWLGNVTDTSHRRLVRTKCAVDRADHTSSVDFGIAVASAVLLFGWLLYLSIFAFIYNKDLL